MVELLLAMERIGVRFPLAAPDFAKASSGLRQKQVCRRLDTIQQINIQSEVCAP